MRILKRGNSKERREKDERLEGKRVEEVAARGGGKNKKTWKDKVGGGYVHSFPKGRVSACGEARWG